MRRLAFATSAEHGTLVDDDLLAAGPLAELGFSVEPWVWDAPETPAPGLDGVVLRSCWDYHRKPEAFRAWLEALDAAGGPVFNPARTALWNLDKSYLWEAASWGCPVPDTVWLEPGTTADLERTMAQRGFRDAVVKPAVSLGGFETWRVSALGAAESQRRLEELVRSRKMMVQAFVPEICTEGEVSALFFGGKYSHSVLKRPGDGDFRVQREYGGQYEPFEAPWDLIDKATAIVQRLGALPYARVDMVRAGGRWLVMELELIDPLLFLGSHPEAPSRFARALASALERGADPSSR